MAFPPPRPAKGRKTFKRGPRQRIVEGRSFRLADEVRYIQRRLPSTTAASSPSLSWCCSPPKPAMPGCSTLPTGSPSGWRETGRAKPSTSRKPIPRLRSPGRAVIASTDRRLSIRTVTLDGPPPSSATRSISSLGQLGRKFQTSLVRIRMCIASSRLFVDPVSPACFWVCAKLTRPAPEVALSNDSLRSSTVHRISAYCHRRPASARTRRIKGQNCTRGGPRALLDPCRWRRLGEAHQKAHLQISPEQRQEFRGYGLRVGVTDQALCRGAFQKCDERAAGCPAPAFIQRARNFGRALGLGHREAEEGRHRGMGYFAHQVGSKAD